MDFELSEEHKMIQREVRKLADSFDMEYWREKDGKGEFPHEFFDAFAEQGWLRIAFPEEYGGSGLGVAEAALVLEEVMASGAGCTGATPLHSSIFTAMPIVHHGTEEQKRKYIPRIAAGELKLAISITEPNVGTDTTRLRTTARRDGDQYILNGQKVWCSNAQNAEKMLIIVRTTPYEEVSKKTMGMSLFFADIHAPGVTIREIPKLGRHAVDSNELFIEDLRVPAADLIGEEGRGFYYLLTALNPERILVAAEAVGIGRACLDLAVNYARERVVFDRPIGMNQGIQFPLADSYSKLEVARLMVYKAAWLFDNGMSCGEEANIAKLRAAEAAFEAADRSLQTHGGYGYAQEYHIERLWREVRLYRLAPISQEMVLNYIGEHVLGLPKSY
jgi:acyl-CoA dehydrogenase